jgi:hypothetical protein
LFRTHKVNQRTEARELKKRYKAGARTKARIEAKMRTRVKMRMEVV